MLLDANALLLPIRARFPLEAEVARIRPGAHLAVPSTVIEELDRLVLRGVTGARAAAKLARGFPAVRAQGGGDQAVLELAVRRHAWVVTADRELAGRLLAAGVTVLVPRDRHRLDRRSGRRVPPRTHPTPSDRKPPRRRQRL